MTGQQGPVFWTAGFVNLEGFSTIHQIRFKHILPEEANICTPGKCVCKGKKCTYGNVAVDSIRLECEANDYELNSTEACKTRAVPFTSCAREATDYSSKGTEKRDPDGETDRQTDR